MAKIHHDYCDGPIECAHVRLGASDNGVGMKPHDRFTIPCCRKHHAEQHQIGEASFAKRYGLDLLSIAADFARLSPDTAMKESLRDREPFIGKGTSVGGIVAAATNNRVK